MLELKFHSEKTTPGCKYAHLKPFLKRKRKGRKENETLYLTSIPSGCFGQIAPLLISISLGVILVQIRGINEYVAYHAW